MKKLPVPDHRPLAVASPALALLALLAVPAAAAPTAEALAATAPTAAALAAAAPTADAPTDATPAAAAPAADTRAVDAAAVDTPAVDPGAAAYATYCIACHGADGAGVEGLGVNLVTSPFVARQSAAALLAFLKAGRLPDDPASVAGRPMPGFGWVPEAELAAIVAHLKSRPGG